MAAALALVLLAGSPQACTNASQPGPVTSGFSPGPGFAGHWGIDFAVPEGAPVGAVMPGTVSFAGRVVDNQVVTVEHGGGIRTSYSYLQAILVPVGARLQTGHPIGRAGRAHGGPGLHLSLRLGDRYLDPASLWRCVSSRSGALRLVSGTGHRTLYAVRRAARHPGRNLRPSPRGPSDGRRGGAPLAGSRRRHVRNGR